MSLDEARHNATAVLELDDVPSPDPSPDQIPPPRSRGPLGMFFSSSPETVEELTPPSSDEPSGDGSDSAGEELSDLDGSNLPTGEPASSPADPASLLTERHLQKTFRAGIHTGTTTAHAIAARTPGQRHVGMYLSDADDEAAIGNPLASIAYRRGGLAGGKVSRDTSDFLAAVMGVVGYLSKQVRRGQDAREIDGHVAAGTVQVDEGGEIA